MKLERVKNNLTQERLAELAEISPKHITKIESLGVTPSSYLLYKIADVLKVPVDKLLREPD